jgi:hypothetical protein
VVRQLIADTGKDDSRSGDEWTADADDQETVHLLADTMHFSPQREERGEERGHSTFQRLGVMVECPHAAYCPGVCWECLLTRSQSGERGGRGVS